MDGGNQKGYDGCYNLGDGQCDILIVVNGAMRTRVGPKEHGWKQLERI